MADFNIWFEGGDAVSFVDSYMNVWGYGRQEKNWTPMTSDGTTPGSEFYYVERYHHYNDLAFDLTSWKICVRCNTGKTIANSMLLSCGDQTVLMHQIQTGYFEWQIADTSTTKGNLSQAIHSIANRGAPGVLQMTLQPRDPNNNGYRSALLSFGPTSYLPSIQAPNVIKASQLSAAKQIGNIWVGGLAQYLIENHPQHWDKNFDLVIDQEVKSMGQLSAGAAYQNASGDIQKGVLDLMGQWRVYITNQNPQETFQVNGFDANQDWGDQGSKTAERIIKSGLLDLSTGYQADPSQDDYAIDVAGITFCYPAKRWEGTVQLNAWDTYDWSGNTVNDRYDALESSLKAGITKRRAKGFSKIKVFDTNLIGGWVDASDGIETMAESSYFDRNFIHTADDSIKIRAPKVSYCNTTVWQGNVGAVINPSAYGYVNRGIGGCNVDGVYIHRVTHHFNNFQGGNRLAQDDDLGALISNRTGFSNLYFNPQKNQLALDGISINLLYVPSITDGTTDVNSISRVIVISAVNPNSPQGTPNKTGRLGFYPVPTARFVKQVSRRTNNGIQIALGTQDSPFILTKFNVNFKTPPDPNLGYVLGAFVVGNINNSSSWSSIYNPPCCSIPYAYNQSGVQSDNDPLSPIFARLVAKNVRWK